MNDFIKNTFTTPDGLKFLISIAAAVVTVFTPDYIDVVIETVLPAAFGIDVYKISRN